MAKILWGKPKITVNNVVIDATPVEDSTSLTTTRGEKHEARVEGGGNEATRYDKGNFTLEFEIRFAKNRPMPLADKCEDGKIKGGPYPVSVESADDADAPKMTMNAGEGSYEDLYSADEGARRHYYFDSTIPSSGSTEQITWTGIGSASGASQ